MSTTTARPLPAHPTETRVRELVDAFERCTLEREAWNHRAHLAVAMWYLTHHPEGEAEALMVRGIHRFNGAQDVGADPGGPCPPRCGFHATLTAFWLGVGARMVRRFPDVGALELIHRFMALPKNLHEGFYSPGLIWSPAARQGWTEPDLRPLEQVVDEFLAGAPADRSW